LYFVVAALPLQGGQGSRCYILGPVVVRRLDDRVLKSGAANDPDLAYSLLYDKLMFGARDLIPMEL
ncbi:hypothetical protein LSUE1_G009057, partial [Lachnellula suecica]